MKSATRCRPLSGTPDQLRVRDAVRSLRAPSRRRSTRLISLFFEFVRRDDRVVARFGQISRLPVQRLDEADLVVDHHRLLMRQVELRIAVAHLDAGVGERGARLFVLGLAAASRRIQHHAHFHAAPLGGDYRTEQRFVGEQEHPDVQRLLRAVDGVEDRLRRVVGQNDQCVRHRSFLNRAFRMVTPRRSGAMVMQPRGITKALRRLRASTR